MPRARRLLVLAPAAKYAGMAKSHVATSVLIDQQRAFRVAAARAQNANVVSCATKDSHAGTLVSPSLRFVKRAMDVHAIKDVVDGLDPAAEVEIATEEQGKPGLEVAVVAEVGGPCCQREP